MVGGEALRLEALEQRRAGAAAQPERELPGQVVGVVEAGVQALAAERARQVAGVAEQEASALRQARDHAVVHAKGRRPPNVHHGNVGATRRAIAAATASRGVALATRSASRSSSSPTNVIQRSSGSGASST
jgi:hypothetical protein